MTETNLPSYPSEDIKEVCESFLRKLEENTNRDSYELFLDADSIFNEFYQAIDEIESENRFTCLLTLLEFYVEVILAVEDADFGRDQEKVLLEMLSYQDEIPKPNRKKLTSLRGHERGPDIAFSLKNAEQFFNSGEYSKASLFYDLAEIKKIPEKGWENLAKIFEDEEGPESAVQLLGMAVQRYCDTPKLRISLADHLFCIGEYDESFRITAEVLYDDDAQKYSDEGLYEKACMLQVQCAKKMDNPIQVVYAYSNILSVLPKNAEAIFEEAKEYISKLNIKDYINE